MRRNAQVFAMVLLLVLSGIPKALALYTPTPFSIDGNLEEWIKADAIAYGRDSGLPGANLDKLYIAWDDNYLYIAIKTNNTQSWDLAYGIGIDVDPGSGNGYTGDSDAWGRKIAFGNNYAIDYEIYFWWSGGSGITADNFINWTGSGWDYKSISDVGGSFAYTGDTSQGLQTLEIAIPWDALGGITRKFAIIAWIAGGDGSSAVDSLPVDDTIVDSDNEWVDQDVFTNLSVIMLSPKNIDGSLDDWADYEKVGSSLPSGYPGADLESLYVSWDSNYLYIAIKTNNTASWDVAYGIGIDVDPGSGNGYTGDTDAWGRKIGFQGFAVDYEIYFWWSGGSGITADNFINWTGSGWDYKSISDVGGSFAYTGDTSQGLQTLEIAIPWDALGGITRKFAIIAWIAGGDGSSAVDTAPSDSEVPPGDSWTDYDKLSNLATTFEFPDLTVEIKGPDVVGVNKLAEYEVHVKNLGGIGVPSTKVRVYINGTLYKNWTVSLGPKEEKVLTFNWTPTQEGMYRINATVDEENTVVELNENNNVATFDVSVVWVGKISVDGDPSDWPEVSLNNNTFTLQNGVFIWSDAPDDQRTEKDPYLPGGTSSHADLIKFGVAKDERYLYFLFVFKNMSNIKIGDNGATFIAVPIDFKEGGATEFAGEMDTKSILEWDIQVVVNLASSQFSGERVATTKAGSSYESLFYVLSADGSFITSDDAMVGVNLDANTVEVRIPLSFIENSDEIRLQLATGFSYGPAVWNFGDPFANDDVSDIVDTISEAGTEEELSDNIPDYYVKLLLGTYLVEGADVINYREERIMMQQQAAVKSFMTISKYYGIPRFKKEYATYLELMNNITNMDIPEEFKEEIIEIRKKVDELFSLYKEGKEVAEEGMMSLADAIKLYRAYTGMIKVNQRLKEIIQAIASGELERQKWLEEMRGKLTKTIDGDLSDWSVDPVAVDTEGYGQDGANLRSCTWTTTTTSST
ncbi:hypothetical protein PF1109 [Pyrococcus furiosus DSM 3638]|uniref:CARDB domain-containing protein n=1 Tax=Pyrococcus furiosus (strain ATCC 43587 / DSM 3638 / JCM 8422 / Vc1) TaxID=186497 RepID=Q8U1U6_PYRFU|nr:CARDB domain-containing protein [Pyrococcus furiosus]AAL81233.1 hypothetical protein PF1109 [Pyrococcus furiosus DSM 3638]